MLAEQGLIYACILNGQGGAQRIDWPEIHQWSAEQGILWVHLDYSYAESEQWLRQHSGLDEVSVSVLTSEDPRPRSIVMKNSLLLILTHLRDFLP